jgi:hypothetical protein
VAHVAGLYAHLTSLLRAGTFDLEISVDETATATTPAEHLYVATELRRLGVRWTSLAPRLPGRLEKGVDYIGDVDELRDALTQHAAIARACGPYKLSLHSGSDKFQIYPILAETCGELVHIKTAGTSYLEALRTVANCDPDLYREILAFSRERFPTDRATYDISATVAKCADPRWTTDEGLAGTLNDDATRQVCHVAYGSVLTATDRDGQSRFRERLLCCLRDHEDQYAEALRRHFQRHVAPFAEV